MALSGLNDPLRRKLDMWGRLEWYYFIKDKYGDCVGIVEYISEWAATRGTPEDVKKIGIVAMIVIALLVGWYAAEFIKNPNAGGDS